MKRDRTGKFVHTWDGERKRAVKLSLTTTAWQILEQQSQAQGISRSELVEAYARQLQRHCVSEESFKDSGTESSEPNKQLEPPSSEQGFDQKHRKEALENNRLTQLPINESITELQQANRQLQHRIIELEHQLQSVQQTLQQTKNRLQIALDSANAILWDIDFQNNQVIYCGDAFRIWGAQKGTADAFFAVIHPDDRQKAVQALNWAIAGNKLYAQEYQVICPDGTTRWLNSRGQIDLDAMQKNPVRMVGISIDITERKSTEEALRQSKNRLRSANERFRLAAMAINSLIYDWDLEQDYVERTEGLTRILGYSLEEAEPTGNWWRTLIHPDDLKNVLQKAQTALASADQCKVEYRVLHKNKEYVYVLDQCLVVTRDTTGMPTRIVGSTTDITDRKRTEAALAKSNQTLKAMIQACPLAIMGLRADGTVRIWNSAAEKIFGWSQQEVIGQFLPAIPLEKRQEFLNNLTATMQGQGLAGIETQRQRKDSTLIDVQIWSASVDEAQAGISCLSVVADISDRKRTEAALRESEERLRMALDAGKAGVWDWDILKNQITWSERIYEFHGLTPETFGGTMEEFSNLIHPDDRDHVFAKVEQALKNQASYQVEFRALHPDGMVRWLSTSGQVFYHNQQPIRMLGATLDITHRKQAEAEREDLLQREREFREAAEAANRIKDEFLAVLSHELRSPLNPILGWTRLLRTRSFDAQATDRALEIIERNAKLQTQLIEDLLDVSRILRGKLSLNISPVDLITTIESVLETVQLSVEAKAIDLQFKVCGSVRLSLGKSVKLDRSADEHNVEKVDECRGTSADNQEFLKPLIQMMGDSTRLQQIIWNLLSNAIKFTPTGGQIEVKLDRVECSGLSSPLEDLTQNAQLKTQNLQTYAQITVTDTGQGISSEFLPHVFEYFRQADSSTTRQFGGLGLGLAIVRHLVELHGGTVSAESPGNGLGASFFVTLPLRDGENGRTGETEETSGSIASFLDRPLKGVQILVVDDEADIRDLIRFVLSEQEATVRVATSATEALEIFSQSAPDLLISDIGMPAVDGYMLMQQIRQRPANQGGDIPAIALTAYAGELNQKRILAAGFQVHATKPIEPAELIEIVINLLNKRKTANWLE